MGANSFIADGAAEIQIHMEIDSNNIIALDYDSNVQANSETAIWQGQAIVDFHGTCFKQECYTLYSGDVSCKQWRGNWAKSETVSPMRQLAAWLQAVADGKGYYDKKPVVPAEQAENLQAVTTQCYAITLRNATIDWAACCDANPDSLFGGNELLAQFEKADVILYFGTEDLMLKAVTISSSGTSYLAAEWIITPGEVAPEVEIGEMDIVDGLLSEEWSIE